MIEPDLTQLPALSHDRGGWPWTWDGRAHDDEQASSRWPRVSVVTPSYNQAEFLEATIRSVLLQDYANLQYLIVDGGSTDGSVEIIKKYEPWLAGWVSEPDRGQTDAINKGLSMAEGEILAYLNSDDLYLPGALRRVTAAFEKHPEAGMVYGDCRVIDAEGRELGLMRGRPFDLERYVHRAYVMPQQATFWRRHAMEQVGPFDDELHYAMDYDFFIRVGQVFPVRYVPEPLACFRMHGLSKTASQEEKHWRDALAVSERYGMTPWTLWYWIRRLRHRALRALPERLERWIRRMLDRPHDAVAASLRSTSSAHLNSDLSTEWENDQ